MSQGDSSDPGIGRIWQFLSTIGLGETKRGLRYLCTFKKLTIQDLLLAIDLPSI